MSEKVVLDRDDMRRTLVRIAHEIVEKTRGEALAIVGIHRRGAVLAARLRELVADLVGRARPARRRGHLLLPRRRRLRAPGGQPVVHASHIDFPSRTRTVVLVDDVLFTGRTVRAAIDALFDYGRPARVQLAVLADRGHRELPIRPDYVGKNLPTSRARARERARRGARRRRRGRPSPPPTCEEAASHERHLLSIDDLTRDDIERILEPRRELRRGLGPRDQEGARRCAGAR